MHGCWKYWTKLKPIKLQRTSIVCGGGGVGAIECKHVLSMLYKMCSINQIPFHRHLLNCSKCISKQCFKFQREYQTYVNLLTLKSLNGLQFPYLLFKKNYVYSNVHVLTSYLYGQSRCGIVHTVIANAFIASTHIQNTEYTIHIHTPKFI